MDPERRVLAFLIKVVPAFFVLLWLWQAVGVSHWYHEALAVFLNWIYPMVDPTGVVRGVGVEGHDVNLRLLVGDAKTALAINASDVTSNFAMLVALYVSSPIRRRWRRFLTCLGAALVVLFALHAFTLVSVSQEAFSLDPGIRRLAGYSARVSHDAGLYNAFYEQIGMYLYVLLLWFPYILTTLRDTRKEKRADPHTQVGP
jgi:hypothetical protein